MAQVGFQSDGEQQNDRTYLGYREQLAAHRDHRRNAIDHWDGEEGAKSGDFDGSQGEGTDYYADANLGQHRG